MIKLNTITETTEKTIDLTRTINSGTYAGKTEAEKRQMIIVAQTERNRKAKADKERYIETAKTNVADAERRIADSETQIYTASIELETGKQTVTTTKDVYFDDGNILLVKENGDPENEADVLDSHEVTDADLTAYPQLSEIISGQNVE